MQQLVSGYKRRTQKEYNRRHDNVKESLLGPWDLCKKIRLQTTEKWYEHFPDGAVEN